MADARDLGNARASLGPSVSESPKQESIGMSPYPTGRTDGSLRAAASSDDDLAGGAEDAEADADADADAGEEHEGQGLLGAGGRTDDEGLMGAGNVRKRVVGYLGDESGLSKHPLFPRLRTAFFAVLGLGVAVLTAFSLNALFSSYYHHAPGTSSSSSRPPTSEKHRASSLDEKNLLSNGTHTFRKTMLVISLDSLAPDLLGTGLTPAIDDLGKKGVQAEYLQPEFPTLTFPNHWTILTGLHPESHGIVANQFWDPEQKLEFEYTVRAKSWDPKWWRGEPIWATAERAGVLTATYMWPGPPRTSENDRPRYFTPFANGVSFEHKEDQIWQWLDKDLKLRPQLILAYVPDIDEDGHKHGYNAKETRDTISKADGLVRSIGKGIEARNLTHIVDIVVLSDHGMANTSEDRLIFLDDILGEAGMAGIEHKDGWPLAGLRFKQDKVSEADMYSRLVEASKKQGGVFDVYTRESMPARYHFSNSTRIAPVWVIPRLGWAITTHEEMRGMGGRYEPKGIHGYDNEEERMRAIFVGSGPTFEYVKARRPYLSREVGERRWRRSAGGHGHDHWKVRGFGNVEVYSLVAKVLGLPREAPHNGTVGFWEDLLY